MPIKAELEEDARKLRGEGKSYELIGGLLGISEKTVRRWAKGWDRFDPSPETFPVTETDPDEAYENSDRKWPGWTVDDLVDVPGFRSDLWAVNIELIQAAQRQGNVYVPWFFRNLIDLARRLDLPDSAFGLWPLRGKALTWGVAIAGLPVLAEWLDCPPCVELGELIEQHKPWDNRRQRGAYQREARTVAVLVKDCIFQAHASMAMNDYLRERVSDGTKAIAELNKRIPLFDHIPLRLRSAHTGALILDILKTPKEI